MTIDGGPGGASDEGDGDPKKMFFTTSDLVARMNATMKEVESADGRATAGGGGFELQRKMPDGSYRKAEEREVAAADFQSKLKQAGEGIAGLDPGEKIEWATRQRREGNALFARGDYKEAMDVYLTCLVAMDKTPASSKNESSSKRARRPSGEEGDGASGGPDASLLDDRIDEEIKLPVLLNLALCALRLGTPSRAERFCDFAVETGAGSRSAKAYFRRGTARALTGDYAGAASDLDRALELNDAARPAGSGNDEEAGRERAAILRERRKLDQLVRRAERSKRQQKRAMERLFGSGANDDATTRGRERAEGTGATGLYPEMRGPKLSPTRRNDDRYYAPDDRQLSWSQWYLRMIGRCAQKLLDIIGEDDDDEEIVDVPMVDMPVDQFVPEEGTRHKKDA